MAHKVFETTTAEWHYFDSTEEMEASKPQNTDRSWPAQKAEGEKPEIRAGFYIKKNK